MIKLTKILQEIKVKGIPTPEELYRLWREVYVHPSIKYTNIYKDWSEAPININYTTDNWLKDLSKFKLVEYYKELMDLKSQNG